MSLKTELQKYEITAPERELLRARLYAYLAYHRRDSAAELPRVAAGEEERRWAGRFSLPVRLYSGAAVVALFIMVPVFAESALPGDTLYPIKVRVNEGLRAQLLFSPYERLEWEARRIERRVAEARLLAEEGKLTAETEAALEETVRTHTTAFQEDLKALGEQDATNATIAAAEFESALEVQSAVLEGDAKVASSTEAGAEAAKGLAGALADARAGVASSTESAGGAAVYEPFAARVRESVSALRARLGEPAQTLSDAEKAAIEARLKLLDAALADAALAHGHGDEARWRPLLRQALGTTERVQAFLKDGSLRARVSLDTFIPLPTDVPPDGTPQSGPPTPAVETKQTQAQSNGSSTPETKPTGATEIVP